MASSAGGRDYFLEVLQHPSRARSCGWGDSSDFRPIDPPSILQLFARTPDGRILKSPRDIYEAINFVVHVKLWSNEGDRDQSFTPKPISRRGRKPNKAKLQSLMLLQAPPVVYDAMPKPRIAEKSEELEDHDDPEGPDELGEHGMTEDVIAPSQRSGSTGASSTSVTTPAIASAASVSAAATAAGLASASTSTPPVASMTRAVAAAAPAAVSSPLGVASISPTTTIPPMAGPPPLHMALFGNLVSQSYFLTGMNEERGVFFIFDQICLRVEGRYRLKFFLNDVFHR
ncbi:velvet factor [Polychytrium aggregatum]|uniref:velvet factor n=1 Tax=Polychytrium aggregatum TaxID=110093 RepID=UPI0022FE0800|nr:velvet factor [Polychytrium aggregatum]KAI9207095.1 velvet factor [Polychytrium aggregatum]